MNHYLTPRQRNILKLALIHERDRLRSNVELLSQAEHSYALAEAAEGSVGGESADVASDVVEQSLDLSLERIEQGRLSEVEAALRRLDLGTYGKCEVCQQAIGLDRLVALPWTRRCIHCAGKSNHSRGQLNA